MALSLPVAASARSLDGGIEAASDDIRAGISWSGGRASASADARFDLTVFDASLRVAALRGAPRHAGADVLADVAVGRDWSLGAVTLRTEAIGHIFGGASRHMDFGELALGARYGLGPVRLAATAWYAPRQSTIGGDNLHLRLAADAGLPGLPITLLASAGYTTGSGDDARTARLRPGGDYADWKIGAEYSRYPLSIGVDYVGTDIALARLKASPFADPSGIGDRLVARVRFSF
ncbi:TorF family putative porin [Novosphingobium sediminis]|uniref:TorF family putative porin n=1 Tax=Novosphingobium sediminis TaxID=707214 RepID=UPI001478070D|nr:TorF family putative porin [Novosphingobium sediminis]